MNNRLIDILTQIAHDKNGTIYLTLTGESWDISNTPDSHNAKIDRNHLKHSIATHVAKMAPTPAEVY
jgi:hypothetical protein